GPPRVFAPNWQGVLGFDYHEPPLNLSVGFGGEGGCADHFGFGRGSVVRFRGVDFFAVRTGWRRLLEWSGDYCECLGFLVFCDLGIALTDFHDEYDDELAVTAFPRGAWEQYRPKFKPFVPSPD